MSLKVMTILGTRPEIIRLSRIISLLDKYTDHKLVHTGQNKDYELNEVFFNDLQVRKPDHFLNISTKSLGNILGDVLIKSEDVILQEKPDSILKSIVEIREPWVRKTEISQFTPELRFKGDTNRLEGFEDELFEVENPMVLGCFDTKVSASFFVLNGPCPSPDIAPLSAHTQYSPSSFSIS